MQSLGLRFITNPRMYTMDAAVNSKVDINKINSLVVVLAIDFNTLDLYLSSLKAALAQHVVLR